MQDAELLIIKACGACGYHLALESQEGNGKSNEPELRSNKYSLNLVCYCKKSLIGIVLSSTWYLLAWCIVTALHANEFVDLQLNYILN